VVEYGEMKPGMKVEKKHRLSLPVACPYLKNLEPQDCTVVTATDSPSKISVNRPGYIVHIRNSGVPGSSWVSPLALEVGR